MQSNGHNSVDNYEYEEQQEKLAMMKTIYLPMKTWFNSLDASYTAKFEKFPSFWRDLETWPSFRDVKKLYLAVTEKLEAGETVDLLELDKKIFQRNQDTTQSEAQSTSTNGAQEEEGEEKKKKRKNRWGVAPVAEVEFAPIHPGQGLLPPESCAPVPNGTDQVDGDENKKPRRSRWSTAPSTSTALATIPGAPTAVSDPSPTPFGAFPSPSTPTNIAPAAPFTLTPEIMQQTLVLQMQLKQLNDKLLTVVQDAAIEELNPNRPPSPPPKYDAFGKRLNTREVRMKESLTAQRTAVIEQMMKINPLFQPPADFVKQKPFRRLFIPYREYPNYNFIGLIIGPRGNTQKRMERETGCKISIRGRGSIKEGSKGRASKNPDEDEELHCHVQGETEESVEMAAKMIKELLTPVDDEKNEHKQKQLRELALINGTLREDEYCTICGEKGHRPFECPQRTKTFQAANVRCAICGDQSHPTRDCPRKQDAPTNEVVLDNEYMSFMAELGDEGQRKIEKPVVETPGSTIAGGVKIEKKGHQTVIKVTNVMTGLPPVSTVPTTVSTTPIVPAPPAPTPTPITTIPATYPHSNWMPTATTPPVQVAPAINPWGYYYPTAQYGGVATLDGTTAIDPNAAALNPYAGYPTTIDYTQQLQQQQQQQQQYAQQQLSQAQPQQYDYAQYQQYYAQWYAAQAAVQAPPPPPPPPPPPAPIQDADMGV